MSASTICLGPSCQSQLLAGARRGDREAFASLIHPYVKLLYRLALRMTGNPADAEEVRQETLLKAFTRLHQFEGEAAETADEFRAWVARIAANTSIDLIRRRHPERLFSWDEVEGTSDEGLGVTIASREATPEERYAQREMRIFLADAIERLEPDLRRVCLLRDVLHYSTQEVGERLGISSVAVRMRLFRAHAKLRERLRHTRIRRDGAAARVKRAPRLASPCPLPECCFGD